MKQLVYHYCSLSTLLNILEHKTIRLSDINKQNDTNESKALLHITRNRAIQIMLSRPGVDSDQTFGGLTYRGFIVYLIDKMIEHVKGYKDLMAYIACFSESDDYLAQWRGYADNGRGVAIGFDVETIERLIEQIPDAQLEFRKVHYIDTNKNVMDCDTTQCNLSLNRHAAKLVETLFSYMERNETKQILDGTYLDSQAGHWFIPLLQDSFFYKDDSFAEEDEWRLILKDEIIKRESDWENIYNWKRTGHSIRSAMKRLFPKALEFRVEDNDIVSYMDMDFSDGDYMHNDMIREIVIGPNCRLEEEDVFQLLGHFGFDTADVKIRKSDSSYRI